MVRAIFCFCLATICAAPLWAQVVTPNPGGGGGQDDNIFWKLNEEYGKKSVKTNQLNIENKKASIDELRGPKGLVPERASAMCQICLQMLYRHGEPGFQCRPVDADGKLLPMAEIIWKKIQCPICRAPFTGAVPGNMNNKNGMDRDFCMHSIGRACIHSNVWTCPDCGYAALIESFGLTWDKNPINEDTVAFVRKDISPVMFKRMCKLAGIKEDAFNKVEDIRGLKRFSEYFQLDDLQQDQINDWIKYDNAIKIYRQEKAPNTLMARLYLEAAHACRRELNGEVAVPSLGMALEESLSISIRRIQHDLVAASIQIRRDRKQAAPVDPTKAETDPLILCEAAEMIMRLGEVSGERLNRTALAANDRPNPNQFYIKGDMYVLCLRYAGFLDRLGRFDDANKALDKAKTFLDAGNENPDAAAAKFVLEQLRLMRGFGGIPARIVWRSRKNASTARCGKIWSRFITRVCAFLIRTI